MISEIEYKTPSRTLSDALNFDATLAADAAATNRASMTSSGERWSKRSKRSVNDADDVDVASRSRGFMESVKRVVVKLNDSTYVYPGIAIFVVTLFSVIVLFQSGTSMLVKALAILLLVAFLLYTVRQFKKK